MKKTDVAMIILIGSVSVLIAYALVGAIPMLKPSTEPVNIKTIKPYSSKVAVPDATVFNEDAINPTVDVTIGEGSKE